jgi:hypothetical protein
LFFGDFLLVDFLSIAVSLGVGLDRSKTTARIVPARRSARRE